MITQKRITFVSILQIIGPLFVILGHSVNGIECTGFWYVFSKQWIYLFYMPLFFMLSGYLLSARDWLHGRSYGSFVKGKFLRLLVPYLVWNAAFFFPKLLAQTFLSDSVTLSLASVVTAFLYPRQNIWGHTWFLFGIFLVYLGTPLWKKLFDGATWKKVLTIVVSFGLYVLPIGTQLLCLNDLHKDLLFFFIGCWLGTLEEEKLHQLFSKTRLISCFFSIAASVVFIKWYEVLLPFRFIPCLLILWTLFSCAATCKELSPFLTWLSKHSFGIYIMHWPIMLITRIVFYQLLHLGGTISSILMVLAGCAVPVLVLRLLDRLPNNIFKKTANLLIGG